MNKKYQFFNDPGHGWLKVSIAEIKTLGIADKISSYSYRTKNYAYLEEDCDYSIFVTAWEAKHGIKWDSNAMTEDRYNDQNCPVRNMDCYADREYLSTKDLVAGVVIELKNGYSPRVFTILQVDGRRITGQAKDTGRVYRLPINKIEKIITETVQA